MIPDLIDRDDAGVVKKRDGLGLVLESAEVVVVGKQSRLDHLERDRPVEADLSSLVHNTHAAAAKFLVNFVITEVADDGSTPKVTGGSTTVPCLCQRV